MKQPDEDIVKSVFETWLKRSHPDIYRTMKKEYKFKKIGTRFKKADYYFDKWFEEDATGKIAVECKGSSNRTSALGQAILYRYAINRLKEDERAKGRAAIICALKAAQPYLVGVCRENRILLYGVNVEEKTVSRKDKEKTSKSQEIVNDLKHRGVQEVKGPERC